MDWNARIRAAFPDSDTTPEPDVVEELAQHANAAYEASRADGLSRDDAERRTSELIRTWVREAGTLRRPAQRAPAVVAPPASEPRRVMAVPQDLRYAARLLRRQPRFALLAILTIGLGIAATSTGLIVGLSAAAFLARLIGTLLYGVSPGDASTYAGVAALVLLIAMLACVLPALRAARLDPLRALRS